MSTDTFLARRVIELEDEVAQKDARIKFLTLALAEMAAGPIYNVSPEQFSLMAGEGPTQ